MRLLSMINIETNSNRKNTTLNMRIVLQPRGSVKIGEQDILVDMRGAVVLNNQSEET